MDGIKKILLNGTSSSGKTTISKLFEQQGYTRLTSDDFMEMARIEYLSKLPNEYISLEEKEKLHKYQVRKLMFIESEKYDKIIFDDCRQDIIQFIDRKDVFIIVIYVSLENLVRNLLSRVSTEPRGLQMFEQYSIRFIKTDTSINSLNIINRKKFIEQLNTGVKYLFESEEQLIEFVYKIFAHMEIFDDNDHYVKLRNEYQHDYIINTNDKTINEIYEELINILLKN